MCVLSNAEASLFDALSEARCAEVGPCLLALTYAAPHAFHAPEIVRGNCVPMTSIFWCGVQFMQLRSSGCALDQVDEVWCFYTCFLMVLSSGCELGHQVDEDWSFYTCFLMVMMFVKFLYLLLLPEVMKYFGFEKLCMLKAEMPVVLPSMEFPS